MTSPIGATLAHSATLARSAAKRLIRRVTPLALRKPLAVWLDRQEWLRAGKWWSEELLRDLAERDINAYHRFLWSHHLGYASSYAVDLRFGEERIHPSRLMLFADLLRFLQSRGVAPERDVHSVFEVGCSLGYLLRYLETTVFPAATRLDGVDVDAQAVRQGQDHLLRAGSRARLQTADMGHLADVVADRRYDLMFCCGVLMYACEATARQVVRTMLDHAELVVISALAHPEIDNSRLQQPAIREPDHTLIHNVDALVRNAGGRVVYRRWEGDRMVDGNTIYFVFAEPQGE